MVGKGGVLAGLDLSLKLTPEQEAARLAAAQARLLHLRLVLGGQVGDHPQLGPPVCVVFPRWRSGRHQASEPVESVLHALPELRGGGVS
jgi:hypothetical protein